MEKLIINPGFAKWPLGPLFGGDPDGVTKNDDGTSSSDSANSGGANSGGNQNSNSGNSQQNSSSNSDDDDDDDDDSTPYGEMSAKELRRELAKKDKDGKTTSKELDEAKKALDEKERAERDEIDNLKVDLKNVTEERDELAKAYEKSALLNAVILNKDFEFHDPSDVTFFLNRKELKIDTKDGSVDGLKEELKRVAKEKPHLVLKSKQKKDDNSGNNNGGNNGNQQQNGNANGASGFQPGQGGGANNSNKDDRGGLLKKYSSLANR